MINETDKTKYQIIFIHIEIFLYGTLNSNSFFF